MSKNRIDFNRIRNISVVENTINPLKFAIHKNPRKGRKILKRHKKPNIFTLAINFSTLSVFYYKKYLYSDYKWSLRAFNAIEHTVFVNAINRYFEFDEDEEEEEEEEIVF